MSFAWESERYRKKQAFLRWVEEHRPIVNEVRERLRRGEKPADVGRDLEARGVSKPDLLFSDRWTSAAVLDLRRFVGQAEARIRLAEYVDQFCHLVDRLQMRTSRHEWTAEDLKRVRKAMARLEEWLQKPHVEEHAESNSLERWAGEKIIPFQAVVRNRELLLTPGNRPFSEKA